MWIEGEQKYVRKSLRTRDLETALNKAEDEVFRIYSDVKSGRKLFGITLQELVDAYVTWREKDVQTGDISVGRLVTIRSQLKHFLNFKDPALKVAELDANSFYDYGSWRKQTVPGTRDVTIQNEHSTFNHMVDFGYREGLCHFPKLTFRKIKIDAKQERKRRDVFSLSEYDQLVYFMRSYASKKHSKDERELEERLLIRDFILIASNTCCRVGELWELRWSDVESIRTTTDELGRDVELVTLNIRAETSKVGRSRTVVSRGGEYFKRLRDRNENALDDDFLFAVPSIGKRMTKTRFYRHWQNLMEGIGINHKQRNMTYYSLRHFGITCRLRAGVSIFDLAEMAGTSATNIQNHYGHIDRQMLEASALKNFSVSREGLLENLLTHPSKQHP